MVLMEGRFLACSTAKQEWKLGVLFIAPLASTHHLCGLLRVTLSHFFLPIDPVVDGVGKEGLGIGFHFEKISSA